MKYGMDQDPRTNRRALKEQDNIMRSNISEILGIRG